MSATTKPQTHYQVLGIEPTATQAEIDSAGRAKVRANHPDHEPDPTKQAAANERARRINEARSVLGDPTKRAQYDADQLAAAAGRKAEEVAAEVGGLGEQLGEIIDKRANSGGLGKMLGGAAGRLLGRKLAEVLDPGGKE